MGNKVLYASDMDRTLIFSRRFIDEYPTDASYNPVEYKGIEIISYMADEVKAKLHDIRSNEKVTFVPVTTRSLDEYSRVNLGFTPEYAIVDNGGCILHNGEPMEEWEEYVRSGINYLGMANLLSDVETFLDSVDYKVKIIDNRYLFFKTKDPDKFDEEIKDLVIKYPEWVFTRQVRKCYAIPIHFSKQIALRWLWNKLEKPYIIASGDSELDLPMLTLANKAFIPTHGSLVKDKFVTEGRFIDGGILSPIKTMQAVIDEVNKI